MDSARDTSLSEAWGDTGTGQGTAPVEEPVYNCGDGSRPSNKGRPGMGATGERLYRDWSGAPDYQESDEGDPLTGMPVRARETGAGGMETTRKLFSEKMRLGELEQEERESRPADIPSWVWVRQKYATEKARDQPVIEMRGNPRTETLIFDRKCRSCQAVLKAGSAPKYATQCWVCWYRGGRREGKIMREEGQTPTRQGILGT